jgi:hypothetical protein
MSKWLVAFVSLLLVVGCSDGDLTSTDRTSDNAGDVQPSNDVAVEGDVDAVPDGHSQPDGDSQPDTGNLPDEEPAGSGTAWNIGRTDTSYLDIAITRVADGWQIDDNANFDLREGYVYWYYINNVLVKSPGPLRGYIYRSGGVVDVRKAHFKTTVTNEYQWGYYPDNSFFDPDASYSFGPRNDAGGQSVWFLDLDDVTPGIQWLDHTPSWYRGEHTMSWGLRAPEMQIEAGKMMGFTTTHVGYGPRERRARGETHTPRHPSAHPLVRSDDPGPEGELGFVLGAGHLGIDRADGDRDYYRQKADGAPLTSASSFELNEGTVWLPHASEQLRWFIERINERLQSTGWSPYFLAPDYGGYQFVMGARWHDSSPDSFRWYYSASPEQIRSEDSYLGWMHGIANTVTIKHYGSYPLHRLDILQRMAMLEIVKRAGYKAVMFGWGQIELPGALTYGAVFGWQTEKPAGGTVLKNHFAVVPYDEAVAHGFMGFWWGDGIWVWDGRAPRNPNPDTIDYSWLREDTTLLDGATITTERDAIGSSYAEMPDTGFDGYYVGAYLYHQTRATFGGERRYIDFTIDGTEYRAEADGSDALSAIRDQRGVCQVRVLGNKATVVYYNPYAGNEWS